MMENHAAEFEEIIRKGPFRIRFPRKKGLGQDEEWCEVEVGHEWRRIRFHDYAEVFKIPGLYETIFYRTLRCNSPSVVVEQFRTILLERLVPPETLRVLDFGAGNGMVGEALQTLGTRNIVGVDILPEAREAALRDRPWVYNDYLVVDMSRPTPEQLRKLNEARFNALTAVAALGFGDIPPPAFLNAYNLVLEGGWLAFNIKEDFLKSTDRTGFAGLINRLASGECLQVELFKRYCHRLSITGDPLYYVCVVARKLKDAPREVLQE